MADIMSRPKGDGLGEDCAPRDIFDFATDNLDSIDSLSSATNTGAGKHEQALMQFEEGGNAVLEQTGIDELVGAATSPVGNDINITDCVNESGSADADADENDPVVNRVLAKVNMPKSDRGRPTYSCSFSIPTSAVGLLIGKGGLTLKSFIEGSGADVILQNSRDMFPNVLERGITITGELHHIGHAMRMIMIKLQAHIPASTVQFHAQDVSQEVHSGEPNIIVHWAIPSQATGVLIGRQGLRIKYINKISGAWVKVAHPEESSPTEDERRVYIRGTKSQVASALKIVQELTGGRSLSNEDEQERTEILIPRRASKYVLFDETDLDIYMPADKEKGAPLQRSTKFEGLLAERGHKVRVEIDPRIHMGLSQTLVIIYGVSESRTATAKLIAESVITWKSGFASPEVTPRTDLTPRLLGGENLDPALDEELLKVEMCLTFLVSNTSQMFNTTEDKITGEEKVTHSFFDNLEERGCSVRVEAPKIVSQTCQLETRNVHLIASANTLIGCIN